MGQGPCARPARDGPMTRRFLRETDGVTAIEYGLIGCLILVVCIAGISAMVEAMPVPYNALAEAFGFIVAA